MQFLALNAPRRSRRLSSCKLIMDSPGSAKTGSPSRASFHHDYSWFALSPERSATSATVTLGR